MKLENLFKTAFAMLLTLTLFATLPGCNTMEGAGKDVERAGEAIEDAAD